MEHGASDSVNKQSHMEIKVKMTTIKNEVKAPATSTAYVDIEIFGCLATLAVSDHLHCSSCDYGGRREIDFMQLKQEPGLVQPMKCEPAILVKEEILEDDSQVGNEQQCVRGTTTPAGTGRVNEDCGTSLRDLPNVKHEPEDLEIGPTVLQHIDVHYTTNKNMSAGTRQNTIVDDCTKAMPCSRGKKESIEDKLRASRNYSRKKMTEDNYDKAHLGPRPQTNLQQHRLRQQRKTRTTGFKCDRTIHKPHLLSVRNKVNQQNSRKNALMTSNIVASNQNRNEETKTQQKLDVCDVSSMAAKFAQIREVPKQTRVRTGEKRYKCDTCNTRFIQKSGLTTHMRVHTGEKLYQCDTCDARFTRKDYLCGHMRVHTAEKSYQCSTCDARFKRRGALNVHMIVHTSEMPYRCDTCDASFARKGYLIEHRRVHTGEKPYRCDTCDARFKHRSALTVHMRVHTGDKPFRCDTCDKRFYQSGALSVHMRVHTGDKPYPCDTCDARFARKDNLIRHMRSHTG